MTERHRITPDAQPDPAPVPDNVDVQMSEDGKEGRAKVRPDNLEGEARPEWLQEKFKSPEDLANAYAELEKKLSAEPTINDAEPITPETPQVESELRIEPQSAEAEAEKAGIDFDALGVEFAQNGALADETYESLESKGFPRNVVDAYIQGQQAIAAKATSELEGVVGSPEQFKVVQEWAGANLNEAELGAYNGAIDSGDYATARLLMAGINAQYKAAGGSDAAVVKGASGAARESGVQPFPSNAAQSEAVNDPRYATDPGYRAEVERRMLAS